MHFNILQYLFIIICLSEAYHHFISSLLVFYLWSESVLLPLYVRHGNTVDCCSPTRVRFPVLPFGSAPVATSHVIHTGALGLSVFPFFLFHVVVFLFIPFHSTFSDELKCTFSAYCTLCLCYVLFFF